MHVISRKKLREFWEAHPEARGPLDAWHRVASHAAWNTLHDVRLTYPHADPVDGLTVFNVGGNKYRLVVGIDYRSQTIYVKHVLTHAEYDRGDWRK